MMTLWSTLSIMAEKSFTALYRVSLMVLPLSPDRHRPRTKARTTAERVSSSAGMEMEKYPAWDTSAVSAIRSRAPWLMKEGKREEEMR